MIRYPSDVTSIRLPAKRSTSHIFVRGGGLVARMLSGTERLRILPPSYDAKSGSVRVTEEI